jgi:hypothetical protein
MWRPNEAEEALEQALQRMKHGTPAQAALPGSPAQARDIAPLLHLAEDLESLAVSAPDASAALARGRAEFLRQGALARSRAQRERRLARIRRLPRNLATFFAPVVRRGALSTAVVALMVVAILTGTTMMASANSLPGEALYPVKRAAENVQLALTVGDESRASVQQKIDERRIQETRAVLDQRRATEVTFRGIVQEIGTAHLVTAEFDVRLQANTAFTGTRPEVGALVAVTAQTQTDGELVALAVETLPATPAPVHPTSQPLPSATLTLTPTLRATIFRTVTPLPARPIETLAPTGVPVAVAPSATATVAATVPPPPAASATPQPPRVVEIRLEGVIARLDPGLWRVGSYTVSILSTTSIDESVAKAEAGAWVRIRATYDSAGALVAQQVVVVRGAAVAGELVEFQGTIEAIAAKQWTVGGQVIQILGSTVINGEPHLGWPAQVRTQRQGDGALQALEITISAPQEIEVEFVGSLEEVAADHWRVSGQTVLITPETVIEGTAVIGRRVEVQGLELTDGTIRGLKLRVREPATPTATSAGAPRMDLPTPTPFATSIVVVTATATLAL